MLLLLYFGSNGELKIYIVHCGNHFYLACPLFVTCKDIPSHVIVKPAVVLPKPARPGSYESINFGPPPDDDFEMTELFPCDDFCDFGL